jgi:hypothetical protein
LKRSDIIFFIAFLLLLTLAGVVGALIHEHGHVHIH